MPLRRMPKLTPLRAMTVTMLLPGTPCAASDIDLQAAIEMLRKKWSLPATKARARCTAPLSSSDAEQRQGQPLEQQRGRGGVPVVHLVAHVQCLRHQRLQVGVGQAAHGDLHGR